MKREIALIYDADCPNVRDARAALRAALTRSGLEPSWVEYDRASLEVPERFRRFGSPTIIVDGKDVAGESAGDAAASCRVYPAAGGLCGVPPVDAIVAAIGPTPRAAPAKAGGALMSKATASGALGLAFASTFAWLCCLPIATGAFGIALAALAAAIAPWWPVLASASLVLLAVAVFQAVRGGGGLETESCEMSNRGRRRWLFVGIVGVLTVAFLTLPWWSAEVVSRLIR